ncbi:hypothetical protein GCM10027610_032690 [Dactylosporangium cerinum]
MNHIPAEEGKQQLIHPDHTWRLLPQPHSLNCYTLRPSKSGSVRLAACADVFRCCYCPTGDLAADEGWFSTRWSIRVIATPTL